MAGRSGLNFGVNMGATKQVGVGREFFSEIIDGNFYYVDKTRFLRPVLTSGSKVLLFTRPRRFGKTLTLDMFKEFLNVNPETPGDTSRQKRLFKGLDVMEDTELVEKYMGQYPVVLMSFKSVFGNDYEKALDALISLISDTATDFKFLRQSQKLDDIEKSQLEIYLDYRELQKKENRISITYF